MSYLEMQQLAMSAKITIQKLLSDRTEGAFERKHQNISAILIEMGLPYIDGYKPLENYQELLRQVVEERVAATPQLIHMVEAELTRELPQPPSVDEILRALVDAPVVRSRRRLRSILRRRR
jgi:hypothetical protein